MVLVIICRENKELLTRCPGKQVGKGSRGLSVKQSYLAERANEAWITAGDVPGKVNSQDESPEWEINPMSLKNRKCHYAEGRRPQTQD